MEKRRLAQLGFKEKDLIAIINRDKNLDKDAILVKKMLYMKFPRNLNKKELERVKEEQMKIDLEKKFQLMYGLDEEEI